MAAAAAPATMAAAVVRSRGPRLAHPQALGVSPTPTRGGVPWLRPHPAAAHMPFRPSHSAHALRPVRTLLLLAQSLQSDPLFLYHNTF